MLLQDLLVTLIVIGCAAYAAWALMPAGARRALAARMLRLRLPTWMAPAFERALRPAGACGGCDSCGDAKPATPAAKTITLHRRLKH